MKKYIFEFSRHADRMFGKLPAGVQRRILGKMSEWEKLSNPLVNAQKLRSTGGLYRFRVGDYRIICSAEDNDSLVVLVVVKVGHRKDVYSQVM